jgi:hypothetical protein
MARDDDDEDERPKKKSKPARRDDDDDDDDEEERPRKKRKGNSVGGGLIPLKNGKALAGYYCAVFSLIPGLGCILGPIAIILGILGLMHLKENPEAGGKGHAITAIILGLIGPFVVAGLFGIASAVLSRG